MPRCHSRPTAGYRPMWVSRMVRFALFLFVLLGSFSGKLEAQQNGISAERVEASIRRCVNFLYSEQISNGDMRGGWPGYAEQRCGQSALVTLALLSAQERPNDPRMRKALEYLRRTRPQKTYEISLHCMALCIAEPTRDIALIRNDVEMLVEGQSPDGGWGYQKGTGTSDESNAQFAVLALWEASKLNIEIPEECLAKAYRYWESKHRGTGWGYPGTQVATGSMTCAGIASMLILRDASEQADASVQNGVLLCCGGNNDPNRKDPVAAGFAWLVTNFTVQTNPGSSQWGIYYLYALERVGRLTGQRFFGTRDWYREGANYLVTTQDRSIKGAIAGSGSEGDTITSTAMALLFLSKGKRQVVIGHLRHDEGGDWQLHRRAVQNLTGQIEKVWKRELSWQTVNFKESRLETLLETPVLFISGSKEFKLDAAHRKMLKEYVDNGGLIFAEACNGDGCNGQAFDVSFRREMELLFEKPLTRLPPTHAVWSAEVLIDPNSMPDDFWLYGLDACCRTSVIYSPISLSCRWELARPWGKVSKFGPAIDGDIENAVKLGVNVISYATGRELKEKLDSVEVVQAPANYQALPRGVLKLPKIQHAGGADDASRAVLNLLDTYNRDTKGLIDRDVPLVVLSDPSIELYPLLYIHGRNKFVFSEAERAGLRQHFENGGFVMGDSICASKDFANSVRDEFLKAIPDAKWRLLDPKHTFMLRDEINGFDGYDLTQVELIDPGVGTGDLSRAKREGPPEIEALEWNGRIVMVFSPNDMSCAMESKHSIQCKGYVRDDAFRIGINMILFGLSQ